MKTWDLAVEIINTDRSREITSGHDELLDKIERLRNSGHDLTITSDGKTLQDICQERMAEIDENKSNLTNDEYNRRKSRVAAISNILGDCK